MKLSNKFFIIIITFSLLFIESSIINVKAQSSGIENTQFDSMMLDLNSQIQLGEFENLFILDTNSNSMIECKPIINKLYEYLTNYDGNSNIDSSVLAIYLHYISSGSFIDQNQQYNYSKLEEEWNVVPTKYVSNNVEQDLNKCINECSEMLKNSENYSNSDVNIMISKLNEANQIVKKIVPGTCTYNDVIIGENMLSTFQGFIDGINKSYEGTYVSINRDSLLKSITQIQSEIDKPDIYTQSGLETLEVAKDEAKEVCNNSKSTQDDINNQVKKIEAAMQSAEKITNTVVVDKTALKALTDSLDTTNEQLSNLKKEVSSFLQDTTVTQNQVDNMVIKIQSYIEKYSGNSDGTKIMDKTALDVSISNLSSLLSNSNQYSPNLRKSLNDLLKESQYVYTQYLSENIKLSVVISNLNDVYSIVCENDCSNYDISNMISSKVDYARKNLNIKCNVSINVSSYKAVANSTNNNIGSGKKTVLGSAKNKAPSNVNDNKANVVTNSKNKDTNNVKNDSGLNEKKEINSNNVASNNAKSNGDTIISDKTVPNEQSNRYVLPKTGSQTGTILLSIGILAVSSGLAIRAIFPNKPKKNKRT